MTLPTVLLVGAGGHARACVDVIETTGTVSIAGLVGLELEVGTMVLGYPVLGADAELPALLGAHDGALVTVGQIKSPEVRMTLFQLIERFGRVSRAIISPRAYVSRHAVIGEGTIVMHGAVVNAGAAVGRNCIINSQALVEHDCVVADHCHIATAAAINSGVRVGAGTFIGSGSTVRQGVIIGDACIVGMGTRVLADCKAGTRVLSRNESI